MSLQFLRLSKRAIFGLTIALLMLAAQPAKAQWPDVVEAKRIAEEGFIYGLPIVMNYAVMYEYAVDRNSGQFKAPFNQIKNEARVFTYEDTSVVTPNSDTPYSFAWLDLRAEPIVLSMPQVPKDRYYVVQLEDGNTYNYGYIGNRASGNDAGDYMVVGPNWQGEAPKGIKKVFRSSTQFAIAGYRTQILGPNDMPNVEKVQAGYKVQPLSAYLGTATVPAAPTVEVPKIDKDLVKTHFFEYLDFALQFAPVQPVETDIRARLARIGVGPGKTFNFRDLPLAHRLEIALGMRDGEEKIKHYLTSQQKIVNGWGLSNLFGDSDFFKGDWLKRAAGATAGIYGNDAIEATYPLTKHLPNGDELDGSKNNYTITFAAGQYPPVNAFWSVTMYDGKSQLLIKNPINRYLINSPMLPELKKNPDGSLTIYIQKDSPGKDKESNWLPAPDGPIYLVMRLYWPKTEAPSILPPGSGTWSPPPVVLAAQPAPATPDIKAISEEAIIYGLPMSMYYSIMNEYAINKDSGQFKAPFNTIANEPRCTRPPTLQSSRPTATRPIRGCSWIFAPSLWCCACRRWRSTATTRSC